MDDAMCVTRADLLEHGCSRGRQLARNRGKHAPVLAAASRPNADDVHRRPEAR